MSPTQSLTLLGIPVRKADWKLYREAIKERFTDPEKGVEYVYRILDRQINKARGLLTYNALLFATFRLFASDTNPSAISSSWIKCGAGAALFSCCVLLTLLWVWWGSSDDYRTAANDLIAALDRTMRRTQLISLALALSAISTLIALGSIVGWPTR
jgi:hypothetical protein